MKICCLMDNEARDGFACEHGLSLWIEANGRSILFDSGESGAFAENAARLGIDLGRADAAVLSHGHYDHSGGMARFFELNGAARLYARRGARRAHWSLGTGKMRYIGLSDELRESGRVTELDGDFELYEGMMLFGGVHGGELISAANSVLLDEDQRTVDTFEHEQSLLIEENGRQTLIAGCAHRGIINIMERAKALSGRSADVVIGGFHLAIPGTDELDAELVDAVGERLAAEPGTIYYTGHCTGRPSYERLKLRLGDRLHPLDSGDVLEI